MGHNVKESTMKKSEVEVGKVYRAKVSGNLVDVRITAENPHGGWDGVNTTTNRKVRVKSAQRLRAVAQPRPSRRRRIASLAEHEAETVAAAEAGSPAERVTAPTGKKERQPKGDKPAKQRKPSGLDAAAQVLAEVGQPLSAKEMVDRMLAQGLWQTGGKTPAATIYSAIIREISVKGDASRFRKVERGKFELAR